MLKCKRNIQLKIKKRECMHISVWKHLISNGVKSEYPCSFEENRRITSHCLNSRNINRNHTVTCQRLDFDYERKEKRKKIIWIQNELMITIWTINSNETRSIRLIFLFVLFFVSFCVHRMTDWTFWSSLFLCLFHLPISAIHR